MRLTNATTPLRRRGEGAVLDRPGEERRRGLTYRAVRQPLRDFINRNGRRWDDNNRKRGLGLMAGGAASVWLLDGLALPSRL